MRQGGIGLPARLEISVDPERIHDPDHIRGLIAQKTDGGFKRYRIVRRSIDARRSRPRFVLLVELDTEIPAPEFHFAPVPDSTSVIIVGSGPAGYFAALELIEQGIRPIVLERGPAVESRRKSIAQLLRSGTLDPDANYCFGEGGAGAFSDGKLYTRSSKRGDIHRLLHLMVFHGGPSDILVDTHPHIGSDKLPTLLRNIRRTIIHCGGQIHFGAAVSDLLIRNDAVCGVRLATGEKIHAAAVILAVGHSARNIYTGLHARGIAIEAKPIAVGLRVEHPQELIDTIQYHGHPRHPNLPSATYRLTSQSMGRGVYSFCMCPGGMIVPTATREGELAVNGLSFSGRRGPFANAGLVVELRQEDLDNFEADQPFGFMHLQEALERRAFEMAGSRGRLAPAQRMTDFVEGSISTDLPRTSYLPGVVSSPLHELFMPAVVSRLRQALTVFDRRLKGFMSREALLVAVESRTSAPVRIPRDSETMMHPQVQGLFPCGEGAGYAGGITSSALDGQRAAVAAARLIKARIISSG